MKLDGILWIYLVSGVVDGEERGVRDGNEVGLGEGVDIDLKIVEAGLEIERNRDAIVDQFKNLWRFCLGFRMEKDWKGFTGVCRGKMVN